MLAKPHNLLLLLLGCAMLFSVTGCWDYRDINSRSLVFGIGLDKAPDDDRWLITLEIPTPGRPGVGQGGGEGRTGGGEGGGTKKDRLVTSRWDTSLYHGVRSTDTQIPRRVTLGQVSAIVVGAEAARRGTDAVIDLVHRTQDLSMGIGFFVYDGRVQELFQAEPMAEQYIASALERMTGAFKSYPSFPGPTTTLADWAHPIVAYGAGLAPRVVLKGGRPALSGAAVFEQTRLIGWLDEEEAVAANFMMGRVSRLAMKAPCPNNPGEFLGFTLRGAARKIRVDATEAGNIAIDVTVKMDLEAMEWPCHLPLTPAVLREIEETVQRRYEAMLNRVLVKAKRELRCDFLQIGRQVEIQQYAVWKQLNWKETFPEVPVRVKVQAKVTNYGMARTW